MPADRQDDEGKYKQAERELRHTYQSCKLGKCTGTHKLHICIKINGHAMTWHTHMTLM